MTRAEKPFRFFQISRLTELSGRKAHTVSELRSGIATVPAACIFYHTHHAFLRAHRLPSDFSNDFARWATEALQQYRLGERLAGVDLLDYTDLERMRAAFLGVLDEDIAEHGARVREGPQEEDFHFVRAHTVIYPLDPPVYTVGELAEGVASVPADSIFFHFFEARLRRGTQTNDFSEWLADYAKEPEAAHAIEHIDPYVLSLDGLRERIQQILVSILDGAQKKAV